MYVLPGSETVPLRGPESRVNVRGWCGCVVRVPSELCARYSQWRYPCTRSFQIPRPSRRDSIMPFARGCFALYESGVMLVGFYACCDDRAFPTNLVKHNNEPTSTNAREIERSGVQTKRVLGTGGGVVLE